MHAMCEQMDIMVPKLIINKEKPASLIPSCIFEKYKKMNFFI